MSDRTPGPWSQFDDGGVIAGSKYAYGPAYADCVWGPNGPGHGVVADCSPFGQSATPETIANARLIAAAPDLLAILKRWKNASQARIYIPDREKASWDELMAATRVAIARATTEPPR